MPAIATFRTGSTVLMGSSWLRNRRVALVSNAAAVDTNGITTASLLRESRNVRLVSMLAPEHGFFVSHGAGEHYRTRRHPAWDLPVFSLYGEHRRPTRAMLKNADMIVFDLPDIGARPYTYVATLKLVLEAAAEASIDVIVADRPVPLPEVVDGPVTDPSFAGFVSTAELPMSYGMTPGETALWMAGNIGGRVRVAGMRGYTRAGIPEEHAPPWVPPSPAVLSAECARCFPATVCFEAFPSIDHGRTSDAPFCAFGASWIRPAPLLQALSKCALPGVEFYEHRYRTARGKRATIHGAGMTVTDSARFRPALTAVTILHALQATHGKDCLWRSRGVRPGFFDRLFGTDSIRKALLAGEPVDRIVSRWRSRLSRFRSARKKCLLYP